MSRDVAVAQQAQENSAILSVIERVALDPNVDIEKLERMLDMQERVLERNAKQAFAADFVRMKPKLPRVVRNKRNTQTDSNYAPLDDINAEVDPILAEYGFGTAAKVTKQTETHVTVTAELWHRDGHKESTELTLPLDSVGIKGTVNKTAVHATASSITFAKRVAICALLNISTGDDKDGNNGSGIITTEQAVEIDLLLTERDVNKPAFLKYFGVEDVRDIKTSKYNDAVTMLKAKPVRKAAK